MGKQFEEARRLDESHLIHSYGRKPVEFVRGSGMRLYDDDGREYTDFLAGIAVCGLGHEYPPVTEALVTQARKLLHVSNYFYVENRGELAAEIAALLGANDADALGNTGEGWKMFFGNSGAEANEGAIKLARHWGHTHRNHATTVVTARRSFHGRTLATLFATGQEWKQDAFLPPVSGFVHVPLNDIDALEEMLRGPQGDGIVAVMLEPIQGEAGVWPCTPEYMRAARELTSELGMLLICDEVQTGMYRTGKPFAYQSYGVVPDIVSIAKGLGNGVPIGAVCARDTVAAEFSPGDHGSTFGGSPLVCAAALATLRGFEAEDVAARVAQTGPYLRGKLTALPHVVEVRGMGLMLGCDLDCDIAPALVTAALDAGFVINSTGPHTLRFLPPLIVTEGDIDALCDALATLIEEAAHA